MDLPGISLQGIFGENQPSSLFPAAQLVLAADIIRGNIFGGMNCLSNMFVLLYLRPSLCVSVSVCVCVCVCVWGTLRSVRLTVGCNPLQAHIAGFLLPSG